MKKNLKFQHLPDLDEILAGQIELKQPDDTKVEDTDPAQSLLKIIYGAGETGWPVGDLAFFVGKKANPEVQRFILDNLMHDVSGARNPANMNLSDEEITILTRQSNESKQQYIARLNSSIEKDTYILKRAQSAVSHKKASTASNDK